MNDSAIKVWDPLVRIFHWSLVACFAAAFITSEEEGSFHAYAGYAVIGLVLFRILWGFVGSEHAKFKDFVFGPSKVINYLKSLRQGNSERFIGHNPAGGYMVIVMLITLLFVTYSGLKVYATEGHGPLAANTEISLIASAKAEEEGEANESGELGENADEKYWEEIHEIASNFMLALIAMHILGVVLSSKLHKENLVKAMVTGKKDA